MNSTNSSQFELRYLTRIFLRMNIASGIFLSLMSAVTAVGNGLLLLAIWKDPFKTFRTPTSFFVVGLAAADLLTGITVCPMRALQDVSLYLVVKDRDVSMISLFQNAGKASHHISVATMNSSYIILLLFTCCQFTAIRFPHKHRVFVTRRRVVLSVALTWSYFTVFAIISATGVVQTVVLKIDLYFHTTGSMLLLMMAYFCLYKAFNKQKRRMHSMKANSLGGQFRRRRKNQREKQFTFVNLLLLTFVIVCTLPTTVIYYLHFYWKDKTKLQYVKLDIATLLSSNVLFVKFALDPLVYAWRLAQYRRALKFLLFCRRKRVQDEELFSQTQMRQVARE